MSYKIIRPDGLTIVYARFVDGTWQRWYSYSTAPPWAPGELERLLGA